MAENIDSLIISENDKAVKMLKEGRYEEAEVKLKSVLELKQRYWNADYQNIGNTYFNLGVLYREFYQFDEAFNAYDKAEEFFDKTTSNKNSGKIAAILNNEAASLMSRRDYAKALNYLKQALNIINSGEEVDNKARIVVYGNLGIVYAYFDNMQESKKYMEIAEKEGTYLHPFELMTVYENITSDRVYRNNIEFAQRYFKKRQELINKTILKDNPKIKIQFYLEYGDFLARKMRDTRKAFYYFATAEKIAEKEFDPKNPIFIKLFEYISNTYYIQKNYTAALENIQKILILSSKNFNKNSISKNPDIDQIVFEGAAYNAMKLKTKILFSQFLKNGNLSTLNNSLESLNLAITILNKIRLRIDSESTQFLIGAHEKEIYFIGQQIAYEMYKITGDNKYLNMAFQINEKGRGFSLLSSIRSQNAIEYGDVPHGLTDKETSLNRKISAYNEMVLNEKQKLDPDQVKIQVWEEKLFDYSRQYDDLIKFIEKNYPKYYRLKYDNSVISMDEVQKRISEKDIIVEYSLMDTILYTYIISRENSTILERKIDTSLASDCNRFYDVMTKQNFSFNVTRTYNEYSTLGYRLYKDLFVPVESYVENKDVIIIPDGAISYVPFEALLTKPVEGDVMPDYYTVPYLIYEHAFSTSYSSTLHFSDMPHNKEAHQEILAFAPTYGNLTSFTPGFELLRQSDREQLITIPGVKQEVNRISKEMRCQVYEDNDATETNFKKHAADYKILHLAMHTIIDDNNPLYSKLAFSQVQDSVNDNFLHTYEIYNMKLNASLAVLSSCGSGYGKFQEGEGMQSLARGFTYAGCPSILMTLWEVADQSTV
ncbi:MAG TPA: CHAT domain-containing tetratricopeptide repeat protein, partial [Bacteroidales bacterium]|nr:CHAT domain-containing tetratricopeptide repeat protein [Bacteroidales bacterium]